MWEQEDLKEETRKGRKEAAGKRPLCTMLEFSLWLQRIILYTEIYFWDKYLSLKIYMLPSLPGFDYFILVLKYFS